MEPDPHRRFDTVGAVLSAAGMSLLVIGILQAGNNNILLVIFVVLGAAFLLSFFLHIRADERAHKEPIRQEARAKGPDPPGLHRDDRRRGTSTRLRQPVVSHLGVRARAPGRRPRQ